MARILTYNYIYIYKKKHVAFTNLSMIRTQSNYAMIKASNPQNHGTRKSKAVFECLFLFAYLNGVAN